MQKKHRKPKLFFCIYCKPSIKSYADKNKRLVKRIANKRFRKSFRYMQETDEFIDAEYDKISQLDNIPFCDCWFCIARRLMGNGGEA